MSVDSVEVRLSAIDEERFGIRTVRFASHLGHPAHRSRFLPGKSCEVPDRSLPGLGTGGSASYGTGRVHPDGHSDLLCTLSDKDAYST